jgi:hypothetical protein
MLPPAWITTAVVEVAAGRALRPVRAPAIDDDAAWKAIPSAAEMFGSFPPSDGLYKRTTRALAGASEADARETRASRASVRALAEETAPLIAAASGGPMSVARAGAERISRSDLRFFGASLRYHRLIPILVEHPQSREAIEEGKGFTVAGRTYPQELVDMTRGTVLSRRLLDGDIALERYDLTQPADRAHAIAVLTELIPAAAGGDKGSTGSPTKVWLWVTGKMVGHKGESAARYLESFMAEVKGAPIDHRRLRVVGKPPFDLPTGPDATTAFKREATWYRKRDLPFSAAITTGQLRDLMR